ncbi:MAG: hypothetical protein KIT72_00250 [Polyangiaceae bacterium]|nr:hypothetical protein [Polyangiaceae bacterium]MCW5788826.1 hypothetical protein [Polyangiaceae bacterium]
MASFKLRLRLASLALTLPLAALACGSDDEPGGSGGTAGSGGTGGNGGTAGTAGTAGTGGTGGWAPEVSWPHLECDPLVPDYCGYPFPSNVYTVAGDTPTGRQVQIRGRALPTSFQGPQLSGAPWDKSDGFSTGVAAMTYIPNATTAGLPTSATIAASLDPGCPSVLIDAETGERIPHWVDLDQSNPPPDAHKSLMIRPAVRLKDNARYIAAFRNVQTTSGAATPSPAFQALRDGTSSNEPSVAERRGLYADIFERLESAGVSREDLVIAWDYTTASRENNTAWMLKLRDESLAEAAPSYTITQVDENWDPDIAYRIQGTFEVPLYVDDPAPGSKLIFDEDGAPIRNAATPTHSVEFQLLIPESARTTPAKLVQYGHGLLGSRTQIEAGHFRTFMNQYGYAFFSVNLAGMERIDENYIQSILGSGEIHRLDTMFYRLHQGFLNNLMAMRMMKDSFSADATYGQYLDPTERYYYGISQGGISGGVYMALTTDVQRGALGVMGQSYNLLLNRSVDFIPFYAVMRVTYPDSRDQQRVLSLLQMLWDRVEPNGYTPYIQSNTLPGTPSHQVLMRAALGDHQVTTLGAAIMARAVGAQRLETGVGDVWGLPAASNIASGSSYIEYDFGLPSDPLCNRPMSLCEDPHGKLRSLEEARQQLDLFLRTGETRNFCTNGECKFHHLSGCTAADEGKNLCQD